VGAQPGELVVAQAFLLQNFVIYGYSIGFIYQKDLEARRQGYGHGRCSQTYESLSDLMDSRFHVLQTGYR